MWWSLFVSSLPPLVWQKAETGAASRSVRGARRRAGSVLDSNAVADSLQPVAVYGWTVVQSPVCREMMH